MLVLKTKVWQNQELPIVFYAKESFFRPQAGVFCNILLPEKNINLKRYLIALIGQRKEFTSKKTIDRNRFQKPINRNRLQPKP